MTALSASKSRLGNQAGLEPTTYWHFELGQFQSGPNLTLDFAKPMGTRHNRVLGVRVRLASGFLCSDKSTMQLMVQR